MQLPVSQMRRQHREAEGLTQGRGAGRWWKWASSLGSLSPQSSFFCPPPVLQRASYTPAPLFCPSKSSIPNPSFVSKKYLLCPPKGPFILKGVSREERKFPQPNGPVSPRSRWKISPCCSLFALCFQLNNRFPPSSSYVHWEGNRGLQRGNYDNSVYVYSTLLVFAKLRAVERAQALEPDRSESWFWHCHWLVRGSLDLFLNACNLIFFN